MFVALYMQFIWPPIIPIQSEANYFIIISQPAALLWLSVS